MKLTFARGASLDDPKKLFNSSLEGNARRAIDLREGDKIDEAAFKHSFAPRLRPTLRRALSERRRRNRPGSCRDGRLAASAGLFRDQVTRITPALAPLP